MPATVVTPPVCHNGKSSFTLAALAVEAALTPRDVSFASQALVLVHIEKSVLCRALGAHVGPCGRVRHIWISNNLDTIACIGLCNQAANATSREHFCTACALPRLSQVVFLADAVALYERVGNPTSKLITNAISTWWVEDNHVFFQVTHCAKVSVQTFLAEPRALLTQPVNFVSVEASGTLDAQMTLIFTV